MENTRQSGLADKLEAGMKYVAASCLMGMAVVTGADVVGQKFFNAPIFGSEEIVSILAVLAMGFALPYAHSQKSNIGVELLFQHFKPGTRRAVKFCTDLAGFLLFAVVAWRMAVYALTLREAGEVSMNLELPTYYVVFGLAFGFAVFSLLLARDAVRGLARRER